MATKRKGVAGAKTASSRAGRVKAKPARGSAARAGKPAAKGSKAAGSKAAGSKAAGSKPAAHKAKPARDTNGAAAMFQKVAFTMFSVADATRARDFYEDVLGLRRGLSSPDGTWTEYDLPGGGCLALFRHPDPSFARAPGGASVAFEVADLDALNQRLQAAGVVYQGDMVHGPRCRMSNILDSEGNAIILHQLATS